MNAEKHNHTALSFLRVENGPLLARSYSLRYQVYCLDRGFLPRERYPTGMETDEFDRHAMHFVALDQRGCVVGTARLVLNSKIGLPLDRFTGGKNKSHSYGVPRPLLGEISRLAVHAPVRRSACDAGESEKHRRPDIALGLYKEIYRASRIAGLTHMLAAMERPLGRLLRRYAFPFQTVGPEIDYYGPVRPYLLDLAEGERVLSRQCPRIFAQFSEHLQPDCYRPPRVAA